MEVNMKSWSISDSSMSILYGLVECLVGADGLLVPLGRLLHRPVGVQPGPVEVADHQGRRPPRHLQDLVEHRPGDVRRVGVGAGDDPADPVLGAVPGPGVATPGLRVPAARPPLGDARQLRPPVMRHTQHKIGVPCQQRYILFHI